MAEFTEEFDVEASNQYRSFIMRVRNILGERASKKSHNLPVLPSQENRPTRWFDIILRANNRAITLRIRSDNLYLNGYRVEDSTQWLEFPPNGTNPPHLITGSSFLGYGGDYSALERAAGKYRRGIKLDQHALKTAVNLLASSTSTREDTARSLIVIIQMICEPIRYRNIAEYLADTFHQGSEPPGWMLAQETSWGHLSRELLRLDADPTHDFEPPENTQIESIEQAVKALGILVLVSCLNKKRSPRMTSVEEDGQCHRLPQGRPLVEVFSVYINNIDGENPGDLYRTITVIDGLGSQYIYNRKREDSESIQPGDTALLTGPARSISACDSFTIKVALMDADGDFSWDDEVSHGEISWNVFNTTNKYDMPLSDKVDGKYGSATVNYVVFSNAMKATVEVTLINGDGEDPADVYGLITYQIKTTKVTLINGDEGNPADHYELLPLDNKESVLFDKKKSDGVVSVKPGDLIPLSRSVVAVPLNSSLVVRADLWDYDTVSSDDEIAKGTAEFPAQPSDEPEKKFSISGQYGKISVKVTWSLKIYP